MPVCQSPVRQGSFSHGGRLLLMMAIEMGKPARLVEASLASQGQECN